MPSTPYFIYAIFLYFSLLCYNATVFSQLSMWSLHVLLMNHNRIIGDSKLAVGVNVSVYGCQSLCISPVMKRQSVQDVPRLLLNVSWD